MPNYTFVCNECNGSFQVTCRIKDKKRVKCEYCKSRDLTQSWEDYNIYVCDPPRTLGSIADKNTSGMSQEAIEAQTDKNNEYNSNYRKKIDD